MNIYDQFGECRYTILNEQGQTQTAVFEIVVGPGMRPVILIDPKYMDELMTAAGYTKAAA